MVDPLRLWNVFFDEEGKLKMDEAGSPVLDHAQKIFAYGEFVSQNQLPNVTKIFSLKPYRAGLLFAGIAGIGNQSVRSLVETFMKTQVDDNGTPLDPSLSHLGNSLLEFLDAEFESVYEETEKAYRPEMEIILSGYSEDSRVPEIFRLVLGRDKKIESEILEGRYDVVFGGQYDVIQRVVKGIDLEGFFGIQNRHEELMTAYYEATKDWLKENGSDLEIPSPDFNQPSSGIFSKDFGGVRGIFSDNGSLSEQAGINFVEFLIATMINAQDFSDRIPTVGGQIHVAIITPANGFKWISKEEFKFQDHSTPRYE